MTKKTALCVFAKMKQKQRKEDDSISFGEWLYRNIDGFGIPNHSYWDWNDEYRENLEKIGQKITKEVLHRNKKK